MAKYRQFLGGRPILPVFCPIFFTILPIGASNNDTNQSKYDVTSSNPVYLLITTHFGEVFGQLLNDFWMTSP